MFVYIANSPDLFRGFVPPMTRPEVSVNVGQQQTASRAAAMRVPLIPNDPFNGGIKTAKMNMLPVPKLLHHKIAKLDTLLLVNRVGFRSPATGSTGYKAHCRISQ